MIIFLEVGRKDSDFLIDIMNDIFVLLLEGDVLLTFNISIRGIKKFYSHQAEAMDAVFNGSSIVAATPTASGKSMTYFIPVCCSYIVTMH